MARVGAEVRRQDFIEAAVKVIAEYGVANATTRRIAAAANSPLASCTMSSTPRTNCSTRSMNPR